MTAADASARGKRNRAHGHETERMIVRYLRANGFPDACTTRAKLGHDGYHAAGDIDFHPLICLEVKSVASSAWPTWCRQAAAEARPGMVPVVVRRTRGVPDVGAWECRVQFRALINALGPVDVFKVAPGPLHYWSKVDGCRWWWVSMADLVAAVKAVDA